MMSSKFTTIRMDAGNDSNGNPRRVFVVLKEGSIISTYEEGYQGFNAITNRFHREAYKGLTFQTTYSEYKSLIAGVYQ